QLVEKACESIVKHANTSEFDVPPARIHGDLWAGNVLFSPDGVVMIDPAEHGGHPHTDLAMLELFGTPHLVDILAGYGTPGVDFSMLQLHPLAVHAMTDGTAYHRPLADAAAEVVQRYGDERVPKLTGPSGIWRLCPPRRQCFSITSAASRGTCLPSI